MARNVTLIQSRSIWLEGRDSVMNKSGSVSLIPKCKALKQITVVEDVSDRWGKGGCGGRARVQELMRPS